MKKSIKIIIIICIALFLIAGGVLGFVLIQKNRADSIPGEYKDIYDAIQKVQTGDTVFAKEDITCTQKVIFEKSMILDLQGNVFDAKEEVEISEGATLTITNGLVKADKRITVRGGLVLGKDSEVVCKQQCVFGVADSIIKIDGGKITSEYVTIETFGDFEMTSGHAERISTYAKLSVSGGHIDSLSSAGTGKITGGDFGGNEITDPLRNYGTLLEIEGTATSPVTITSKQMGLYTGKNTKTTLKYTKFFAQHQDVYAHGAIIAEGLDLQGVCTFGGDSHFKNCNISCHENSDTAMSNMGSELVLENCTVTGKAMGVQNFAGGKVVVKNTNISAYSWGIINYASADADGNITAGVIEVESGSVTHISNNTHGKVYIKGGTITNSTGIDIAIYGDSSDATGEIVISGGNITSSSVGVSAVGGKLVISGGSVSGETAGVWTTGADMQISGGAIDGSQAVAIWQESDISLSGGVYNGGIHIYVAGKTLNDLLAIGYRYQTTEYVDFNSNNTNADISVVAQ